MDLNDLPVKFTLDGKRFAVTRSQVREALKDRTPRAIRTHWVEVDDRRFPPTQALSEATGVPLGRIRSEFALDILGTLYFKTDRKPTRQLSLGWIGSPAIKAIVEQIRPESDRFAAQVASLLKIRPFGTALPDQLLQSSSFGLSPIALRNLRTFTGIETAFDRLKPLFAEMAERYKAMLPPNWDGDHRVGNALVETVIRDEGIPLVWVPRREVIDLLLSAEDRNARLDVLIQHQAEVVEDCRTVLASISQERFAAQVPLALLAVEAIDAGHHEAAQALAVLVADASVVMQFGNDHTRTRGQFRRIKLRKSAVGDLRWLLALMPLVAFFTHYQAGKTPTKPEVLSRHVLIHSANVEDFTPVNALIAVMTATSFLKGLEEIAGL